MNRLNRCKLFSLCLLVAGCGLAQAHGDHGDHSGHGAPAAFQEKTSVRFADVQLLDQNGMPVRLEKDLVSDHLVVMGFIYTSCTTV
ncbi:MAG: SCO family protein, partial [Pseudomonas sp.]